MLHVCCIQASMCPLFINALRCASQNGNTFDSCHKNSPTKKLIFNKTTKKTQKLSRKSKKNAKFLFLFFFRSVGQKIFFVVFFNFLEIFKLFLQKIFGQSDKKFFLHSFCFFLAPPSQCAQIGSPDDEKLIHRPRTKRLSGKFRHFLQITVRISTHWHSTEQPFALFLLLLFGFDFRLLFSHLKGNSGFFLFFC